MAGLAPLKAIVIPAVTKQTATVIFLHGLGDTGYGWSSLANEFRRDEGLSHVKWILPHAPQRSITGNMGMQMPAWYDIISFDFDNREEDEDGMLKTVRSINALLSDEIDSGTPSSRILLGGFSQGAAMSLLTGLTSERKLAGISCLSGYIPLRHKFKAMSTDNAKKLPIFWGHGKDDPLVKYKMGQASAEFLENEIGVKKLEVDVEESPVGLAFHGYAGVPHSVNQAELDDLRAWIKRVIPKSDETS